MYSCPNDPRVKNRNLLDLPKPKSFNWLRPGRPSFFSQPPIALCPLSSLFLFPKKHRAPHIPCSAHPAPRTERALRFGLSHPGRPAPASLRETGAWATVLEGRDQVGEAGGHGARLGFGGSSSTAVVLGVGGLRSESGEGRVGSIS